MLHLEQQAAVRIAKEVIDWFEVQRVREGYNLFSPYLFNINEFQLALVFHKSSYGSLTIRRNKKFEKKKKADQIC